MRFCTISTRVHENIYDADKNRQLGAELQEKKMFGQKKCMRDTGQMLQLYSFCHDV